MIKCDPRAIARCPFKKPCGGDDAAYFMEGSECDEFNKQVLAPPPTNADRIRAMSDEELAVWLCGLFSVLTCYTHCPGCDFCNDADGTSNGLKKWLQQPAEEDDYG